MLYVLTGINPALSRVEPGQPVLMMSPAEFHLNTESFANVIIDGGGSERAVPIVPTLIFGEREEVRERTGTAKHIAIMVSTVRLGSL